MAKKCVKCQVPIEGFWSKVVGLAGVKKSAKNPDYCNKCEQYAPATPEQKPVEPPTNVVQ